MKDLESMNSGELKDLLANEGKALVESEEQAPSVDREEASSDVDSLEEEVERGRDPMLRRMEAAQQRRDEYNVLSDEEKLAYHGLPAPEQVTQQQTVARFEEAIRLDTMELADRYGNDLVQDFSKDFQLGRVKMSDDDIKKSNAVEDLFLRWIDRPSVANKLTSKDLEKIITAANDKPLRSRSVDVVRPDRIRPVPKPKPKPEKTYRVPNMSNENIVKGFTILMKEHPELFE